MAVQTNEDIYEYHFGELYKLVKSLIGKAALGSNRKEDIDFPKSNLLFDVGGADFSAFKTYEAEYRCWVEVHILKIIENILSRKGICFEERFYGDGTEQNSIVINLEGRNVEAFFLFDVSYENSNNTDYDKLAETLMEKVTNVDEINVFIFRDSIGYFDLANLVNGNAEMNGDGFMKVFPLKTFFDKFFDDNEYSAFINHANAFYQKCNREISYKTVITPSPATIKVFREKKNEMLKEMDYQQIADLGLSGYLIDSEFKKVYRNFMSSKMYLAVTSSNDFAESFISAEWSYDVYQHAMGELELTGIIAGYLKSIEQLLFTIARFHQNEGLNINSRNGKVEFTSDNESFIDSTLGSLNSFITAKEAKLALDAKIRGCINKAISNWTRDQRNGYFHKHNLYREDNKIKEVRDLTIYLYFLILGGIQFTEDQKLKLGVKEVIRTVESCGLIDEYSRFESWFTQALDYDLPYRIPGLWLLVLRDEENQIWEIHPFLMNHFYLDDFTSSGTLDFSDTVCMSHTKDIPAFKWKTNDNDRNNISLQIVGVFSRFFNEHNQAKKRVQAIIMGLEKELQLVYFRDDKEAFS